MDEFAQFALGIMATVCTPARDDDLVRLRTLQGEGLLTGIFDLLSLMRLDVVGFLTACFVITPIRIFLAHASLTHFPFFTSAACASFHSHFVPLRLC